MKNSSPYRKPPLRRTRDSFIDDKNSVENPRIDLGRGRNTQVRRDKDKVKGIGITLYDIDFAVKSFIDQTIQIKVDDNGEGITVPTLYANSEKWASIQRNGHLKDKKGKTLVPLITFRRSGVNMKSELRRNKVATTNQLGYVLKPRYSVNSPYDKWSTMYGNSAKPLQEYFVTPIPDYVDVTYDFIAWTEYQNQLNFIVEQFVYFTGQSFGERNSLKFSTNVDSFSMEDNNTTGQDRVVRASFQITVHGYLLPKQIGTQTTTRKLVTPNSVIFGQEVYRDLLTPASQLEDSSDGVGGLSGQGGLEERNVKYNNRLARENAKYKTQNQRFGNPNKNTDEFSDELRRRLEDFDDISINRSPDVYSTEND